MNPFNPLYEICNSGTNAEKNRDLREFPRIIDLELTNACNFRCLMCPTGNLSMKRLTGFMTEEVFECIVDDCKPHKTALRFIGWGEPTMHPDLPRFIKMAHDAGLLTHLNTNGSKMTEELAEDLIEAGLDSIKFSFQGVDKESFAEMRNIDWFPELLDTIRMFSGIRNSRPFPFIAVSTTTTHETPEKIELFRRDMESLVDQVSIGKTVFRFIDQRAVRLSEEEKQTLARLSEFEPDDLHHPKPCPEVFDKLSIHFDGTVAVCCNDYNGVAEMANILKVPISLIWMDKGIEAYREKLANDDYSSKNCDVCYDYLELQNG